MVGTPYITPLPLEVPVAVVEVVGQVVAGVAVESAVVVVVPIRHFWQARADLVVEPEAVAAQREQQVHEAAAAAAVPRQVVLGVLVR